MISKNLIITTVTLLILFNASSAGRCPKKCSCHSSWIRGVTSVVVDCSKRGFTTIPRIGVPRDVTSFVLNDNLITEIPSNAFRKYRYLRELYLYKNFIGKIHPDAFKGLRRLKDLSLHSNQLKRIENGTFVGLRRLDRLYIFTNLIQEINERVFDGAPRLTVLYMHENLLRSIPSGTFKQLTRLKVLLLHRNHIQFLLKGSMDGLVSTSEIILHQNKISQIEEGAFQDCKRTVKVQLGNNLLKNLTVGMFTGLPNLKELYLDKNKISNIENADVFKNIAQIHTLILSGNRLTDVKEGTFAMLHSIRVLSLASNRISRIIPDMFNDMPLLHTLHLQENEIISIQPFSFHGMTSLVRLYLFRNKITSIQPKTFTGLFNLVELNLGVNKILGLSKDAFHGLISLVSLQLNSNFISVIPAGAFPKLRNLYRLLWYPPLTLVKTSRMLKKLKSNNLQCSCETKWLKHWMLSKPGLVGSIFCETPLNLKTRNLTRINDTDFKCEQPVITVHPKTLFLTSGSNAKTRCSINAVASFKWIKNGKPLTNQETRFRASSSILVLPTISEKDSGEYICLASTGNDTFATNFILKIGEKPSITGSREELVQARGENENVILRCPATGTPPPLFIWYYNGEQVIDGKDGKFYGFDGRTLIVTKVNSMASGIYKCVARNEFGFDIKIFNMKFTGNEGYCKPGCNKDYSCKLKYVCEYNKNKNSVNQPCLTSNTRGDDDTCDDEGSAIGDVINDDSEPDDDDYDVIDDENEQVIHTTTSSPQRALTNVPKIIL